MNQWKRELDEVANSFSEEKKQLLVGIMRKKKRHKIMQRVKRTIMVGVMATALGLFTYDSVKPDVFQDIQANEITAEHLQLASPKVPIYFNQQTYSLYNGIFEHHVMLLNKEGTPVSLNTKLVKSRVYELMMYHQAMEYKAQQMGLIIDKKTFAKAYSKVDAALTIEDLQLLEKYAFSVNSTPTEFIEKVYIPVLAKQSIIQDFLLESNVAISKNDIEYYYSTFKKEIVTFMEKYNTTVPVLNETLNMEPRVFKGTDNQIVIAKLGKSTFEKSSIVAMFESYKHENLLSVETIQAVVSDGIIFEIQYDYTQHVDGVLPSGSLIELLN